MNTKAELKKYSEFVATIKSITRVYEQAAARKMAQVRIEIEKIRDYLAAATGTYNSTKWAVVEEEENKKLKEAILKTSFRQPTAKRVLVLISSQSHYYGNLVPNLFNLFLAEYQLGGCDGVILGNIGYELFKKSAISQDNISHFDFDDAKFDWNVIHRISGKLGEYQEIVIFYGEYRSVLTQEARRADVAKTIAISEISEIKKYLIRPAPPAPLSFLEKQIIAGDFLQKIYESQLAKYGARIKILEIGQVAEKISEAIDTLGRFRRKVRKNVNNKKQLQLFTGSNLWQKETTWEI